MTYYVKYKMFAADEVKGICAAARNKEQAYEYAVYELIRKKEGSLPYSAWVDGVTYSNGKVRLFNTHEGKRY